MWVLSLNIWEMILVCWVTLKLIINMIRSLRSILPMSKIGHNFVCSPKPSYYLPHHVVFKTDSTTTSCPLPRAWASIMSCALARFYILIWLFWFSSGDYFDLSLTWTYECINLPGSHPFPEEIIPPNPQDVQDFELNINYDEIICNNSTGFSLRKWTPNNRGP